MLALVLLLSYGATIVGANWALTTFGVVPVGFGLAAPAGVFFAGLALGLRDLAQERAGKGPILGAILAGTILSAFVSPQFALASGSAFLLSELADFVVYSRLRARSQMLGVVASNLAGDVVDSALFLWMAFGSLQYLEGQLVGKYWMVLPVLAVLPFVRKRLSPAEARA